MNLPYQLRTICLMKQGSDYRVRSHAVSFHQLYILIYGQVESRIGSQGYELRPDQVLLIPPDMPRAHRCVGKAPGYVWVLFQNHGLALDDSKETLLTMTGANKQIFLELLRELKDSASPHSQALIHSLFSSFFLMLLQDSHAHEGRSRVANSGLHQNYQERIAQRIEDYLRQHIYRPVTNAEIAGTVGLSPSQASRIFRATRGISPLTCLKKLRIDHAAMMLESSTLSISEISMQLGFSSFSHFTRLFRRETGTTPRDYRTSAGAAAGGKAKRVAHFESISNAQNGQENTQ